MDPPAQTEVSMLLTADNSDAFFSGNTKPEGLTDTQGIKGVPEFWLGAMRNCSAIAGNITEKDEVIPYSTAGQSLALSLSVCLFSLLSPAASSSPCSSPSLALL